MRRIAVPVASCHLHFKQMGTVSSHFTRRTTNVESARKSRIVPMAITGPKDTEAGFTSTSMPLLGRVRHQLKRASRVSSDLPTRRTARPALGCPGSFALVGFDFGHGGWKEIRCFASETRFQLSPTRSRSPLAQLRLFVIRTNLGLHQPSARVR